MKTVFTGLFLAVALYAGPAAAGVCLDVHKIERTYTKDGKTLDFTMRDGSMYRNHLRGTCSDLRFNGFVWTIDGVGQVCENEQSLRVLDSGQICTLGTFDPPVPRKTIAKPPG
jgi:hypothetical protein